MKPAPCSTPHILLVDDNADGLLVRRAMLEEAGYVVIDKRIEGRRPRTWVRPTRLGRDAFMAEIHALKVIVGRFERDGNGRG